MRCRPIEPYKVLICELYRGASIPVHPAEPWNVDDKTECLVYLERFGVQIRLPISEFNRRWKVID